MNAVLQLKAELLEQSRRPYLARGCAVARCPTCALVPKLCLCPHRPNLKSRVEFGLLMHPNEPYKPSNTGKLVADVLPATRAWAWHRTEPPQALLDWLDDNSLIVFPMDYVPPERQQPELPAGPVKLLLLDATWQQARKMLRTSRYLDGLPVTGISDAGLSQYRLRNQYKDNHLCTAEVAALMLDKAGEAANARALECWFQAFSGHYLAGKLQRPPDPALVESLKGK
ncbi:DTW domain-containing protein [Gallaecimonas sp. GXIMD4217]|uniref:tRNA-uridine aminocarboxypropyltransferase n=1 Tax=Gallaecimonas sp. GXIMD4217 TaxID=3131927 RepID=UPI00311AEB6A